MRKLLLSLFFILITSPAFAVSYYISCTGDNTNTGTDTSHPWADFNTNAGGTNFLQPGDVVNFKTDCTFTGTASQVWIKSKGSSLQHITFQTYGGGADPLFNGSVDPSVDVPSWSGWTSEGGGAYVTNVVVPWSVNSIIIDDSYSLRKLDTFQCGSGGIGTVYSECQSGPNTVVHIHLPDGSDPTGHTVRFARYGNGDGDNHTRGLYGVHDSTEKYIDINHMKIKGSNTQGFSSGAPYVTFNNCRSDFAAREGWYIIQNAVQNVIGARYNTISNSIATWSNSNFGQQFTIESSHVDLIDVTSAYGWMAGIDWLGYNSQTEASNGRCIRCISHDNGQRAWQGDYNGFDPFGIYIDGGHNIQIIDSVIYEGSLPDHVSSKNAIYGIAFQTEHPSTNPDYNIDLVNSLLYGGNYVLLNWSGALNCSGAACVVNHDIRLIGNTFIGTNLIEVGGNILGGISAVNNVLYSVTGNTGPCFWPFSSAGHPPGVVNYNLYYTANNSGVVCQDGAFTPPNHTLAQWQALYGSDLNSQYINPIFAGSGITGGIDQSYHLSAIASGQGSNSPGLAVAAPNYLGNQYVWSSIGTVRTDNVVDNSGAPAVGYHYLAQFTSSNFPSNQSGTDYF